jgi:hypothetical protein
LPTARSTARGRMATGRGPDDGDIARFAQVVNEHRERFGRRDELEVLRESRLGPHSRQRRPSRSISASASAGPQVAAW